MDAQRWRSEQSKLRDAVRARGRTSDGRAAVAPLEIAHIDLERYFLFDREVAVFDGRGDLLEKVRHWREHEDLRKEVADAGYRRVLAEHTYDHRFAEIFRALRLDSGSH